MLYLWYVLFIGHSEVMGAVERGLAHNKKIKSLAGLCGLPHVNNQNLISQKRKMRAYVRALVEKLSLAH